MGQDLCVNLISPPLGREVHLQLLRYTGNPSGHTNSILHISWLLHLAPTPASPPQNFNNLLPRTLLGRSISPVSTSILPAHRTTFSPFPQYESISDTNTSLSSPSLASEIHDNLTSNVEMPRPKAGIPNRSVTVRALYWQLDERAKTMISSMWLRLRERRRSLQRKLVSWARVMREVALLRSSSFNDEDQEDHRDVNEASSWHECRISWMVSRFNDMV